MKPRIYRQRISGGWVYRNEKGEMWFGRRFHDVYAAYIWSVDGKMLTPPWYVSTIGPFVIEGRVR